MGQFSHLLRSLLLAGFGLGICASGITQASAEEPARTSVRGADSVAHLRLGQAAFPLNGPWKFTVGDSPLDPATGRPLWAEQGFDDAHWENVDLTPADGSAEMTTGLAGFVPGWTTRGHAGYSGYAWYRIRVAMDDAGGRSLALAGPAVIDDAYQVFADGVLLGSFGRFSGKTPVEFAGQPMLFPLPKPASGDTRVLAFRVWMSAETLNDQDDAGGIHTAPILGEATVVGNGYTMQWLQLFREYLLPEALLMLVSVVMTAMAFTLLFFDRSDKVYLWMGGIYLLSAVTYGLSVLDYCTQTVSFRADFLINDCLIHAVLSVAWVMVWWIWFGRPRPSWTPHAAVALGVVLIVTRVLGREIFAGLVSHGVAAVAQEISLAVRLLFVVLTVWIVIQGIRRQGLEGWLVLPAVLLRGVSALSFELIELRILPTRLPFFGQTIPVGLPVYGLLFIVITVLLLRRLATSVRNQRQMALDVKQAQEVQQMIVPEAQTEYPGLTIESVFRPAREVGGDFFQILPHPADGSLLIVAGDVAGKGLQAGMLVALLVGAIRTALETSYDPATVLSVLNRRLIGRGQGATTCLALRIAADGAVKLANAGHLPPYLNGKQLPMEGALPLGIFAGAEPSTMRFQLTPEDRLLLISDGILEATDPRGELFGFERIAALVEKPISAAHLADAAQAFGQEDDISVIAVTRTAVEQPALA